MNPERVIELARRSADEAEVFAVESEDTPVHFEGNRLKSVQSRSTSGCALRVIRNGRMGFASSTRSDGEADLVRLALEVAELGAPARFHFPGAAPAPDPGTYDEATARLPVAALLDLGNRAIHELLDGAPELVCEARVDRQVQRVRLLNTAGLDVQYARTSLALGLEGTRVRGTDMLFVGGDDAGCAPDIATDRVVGDALRQYHWAEEPAEAPTGRVPVCFTPVGVAWTLMEPLEAGFNGKFVVQGSSPIAGDLGKQRYDARFSMTDDPLLPMRPASRPCDDEGVPSGRLAMVEAGVIRRFRYDLTAAAQAGVQSTGSAERSLISPPTVGSTNVLVAAGDRTFEQILALMGDGLVIEMVLGAGQGNVIGGEFSGNVLLGYAVRGGRIAGRVKDTIVSGNVHQALSALLAVGSDGRWIGGTLWTPSLCFSELTVARAQGG